MNSLEFGVWSLGLFHAGLVYEIQQPQPQTTNPKPQTPYLRCHK